MGEHLRLILHGPDGIRIAPQNDDAIIAQWLCLSPIHMDVKDWVELAAALEGAASGLAALMVWLFGVGRKVGQLESRLQRLEGDRIDPREWGKFRNQVETMYSIYVGDVVRQNVPSDRGDRDER